MRVVPEERVNQLALFVDEVADGADDDPELLKITAGDRRESLRVRRVELLPQLAQLLDDRIGRHELYVAR
jgi:hypothetical protein